MKYAKWNAMKSYGIFSMQALNQFSCMAFCVWYVCICNMNIVKSLKMHMIGPDDTIAMVRSV